MNRNNRKRVLASSVKAKQEVSPAIDQVFCQDELREIIMDYAIRNKEGSVCRQTIPVFRLVQKAWLRTTTKILRRTREPLFHLELNKNNSVNGTTYVRENGKLLDIFINTVTSDARLDDCIPTCSLKIMEDFFRQENHQSFSNLLVKCGDGLVGLDMYVPAKGGSLTCLFPLRVNFPLLKKLTVKLTEAKLKNFANGEAACTHSSNITYLIHYLLHAAETLTEFRLPYHKHIHELPSGFDLLCFPSTLTQLELKCKPRKPELEMLVRCHIPSLAVLTLHVPRDVTYAEGLLYRVLDNFRTTLNTVKFIGISYAGPPRVVTLFRFPLMEKLEKVTTCSINLELDPESSSLEKYLPKIHTLSLFNQTVEMCQKWTENSKFPGVTFLQLKLVNNNVRSSASGYAASLDLDTMQRLHLTFSNLRRLELNISVSQTCGLKYMFMEMRQLTDLTIICSGNTPQMKSDIWDALLIGVSVGFIADLRSHPEEWEVVKIENDNRASIRMMTALTSLSLEANCSPPTESETLLSLISDFAFHHAFLKMTGLKTLNLQGRFKATDEMSQLWIQRGKTMVYTPCRQP